MGLPQKKVKTHLYPKNFEKLDLKLLQQYADLFNISSKELKDIQRIKNECLTHEN
jgi:hypothetical protein